MKKFIISIVVFFALVAGIDYLFGKAMSYMYANAKGGYIKELNDVCLNNQYDVLVMGSSRAHHHYVPTIITDSLKMTCFNVGQDGNGIIMAYGIYQLITNRYKPSLIIYDLAKGFDIYENKLDQGNTRYLAMLKPYSYDPHIKKVFLSISQNEWLKTLSNLYRFNSITLPTISYYVFQKEYNKDGYRKLESEMDYEPTTFETDDSGVVDPVKIFFFEHFIKSTQEDGIPLICVISPRYRPISSDRNKPIFDLCKKYNIPLLDYYGDEDISVNRGLFKDATHMNDKGARAFTQKLSHKIKSLIK